MDPIKLLSLLSDGDYHSGSDLGKSLGVSRTAVWKSLSAVEEYGLQFESVKGKGYRLTRPIELLDHALLLEGLDEEVRNSVSLSLVPKLESTNSAIAQMDSSDADFEVLMSEMQTAGRGRRGRQWVSPFGQNIYLSMRFELQGGPRALEGLSLVAGLAVVQALQSSVSEDLSLKWPNDILIGGRKLAGVLVELQGEATTGWTVILGVGLNYAMQGSDGAAIDQPWVSLSEHSQRGRNEVASAVLNGLVLALQKFRVHGFSAFRSSWLELDYFKGKSVQVLDGDLAGIAMGVDDAGNMLVKTDDGVKAVNAGELSVRAS